MQTAPYIRELGCSFRPPQHMWCAVFPWTASLLLNARLLFFSCLADVSHEGPMRPATAVLVGLAFVVGLLAGARFDTRRKVHESVSGRDHAKSLEEAMLQATGSRHVLDAGLIAALSDFFKTSSSHEQLLQRVTAAPVPGPSPGPGSGRGPAPTLSALEALPESKPERRPAREADADVATPPHVASTLPQVSQGEATTEARPAGHSERSARALAAAQAPPRAAGRKPFKTLVNPSEPPGYQEGLSGAPYNASCAFVSVFNTEMHFTYFAVMVYTMRMVAKSRCDLVAVIDANAHRLCASSDVAILCGGVLQLGRREGTRCCAATSLFWAAVTIVPLEGDEGSRSVQKVAGTANPPAIGFLLDPCLYLLYRTDTEVLPEYSIRGTIRVKLCANAKKN